MKVADMHCDTVAELYYTRNDRDPKRLFENDLEVDLKKLKKGDYLLQNFALFLRLSKVKNPFEYCVELAELFKRELSDNSDRIIQAVSYADIERAQRENKIAAVLTVEEGEAYEGSLEKLNTVLSYGVKMTTLTWNFENSLAFPNARPDGEGTAAFYNTENGLKPRGFEFVEALSERRVIIDVSHLSDKGFYDVAKTTRNPFCASHSNARAVCAHPRNLTDDMIRLLADRGGVTGINYFGLFLRDDNPEKHSRVEDIIRHIKHIRNIGGIGVIGLGSDFDGISGELELKDAAHMPALAAALEQAGFTTSEIEAIFYKNVLRMYKEVF